MSKATFDGMGSQIMYIAKGRGHSNYPPDYQRKFSTKKLILDHDKATIILIV